MKQRKRLRRVASDERVYAETVKGTSRRVVVVPAEPETVFEQIIYVVRDDALSAGGVSAEDVLRDAEELLQPPEEPPAEKREPNLTTALLWLSGIATALTSGILLYWCLAM